MKQKKISSESEESLDEYSSLNVYLLSKDKRLSFRLIAKDKTNDKVIKRYEELRDYCLKEATKLK